MNNAFVKYNLNIIFVLTYIHILIFFLSLCPYAYLCLLKTLQHNLLKSLLHRSKLKYQIYFLWRWQKYRTTWSFFRKTVPLKAGRVSRVSSVFFVHTSCLECEPSHLFKFCFSVSLSFLSSLATARNLSTCRCLLALQTTAT